MCAKIEIPEALKSDMPQNKWGKVLAATPIVMTVIATLLAGLSNSEMTRAQYDRSLAAQQQSKAGDQWSYFQAKRLRAALQRNTLDLLRANPGARPLDPQTLAARLEGTSARTVLDSEGGRAALDCLTRGALPKAGAERPLASALVAAMEAVEAGQSDPEINRLLGTVKDAELAVALVEAATRVRNFDALLKPMTQAIDAIEKELSRGTTDGVARDFVQARLAYAGQRYDQESRQNQVVAQLYELQVRKSNLSAERHHSRSQRFFYGMLAAQLAVIVSTFSMAARKKNFLWAIAATAGSAAVAFASYVYVYV